MSGDLILPAVGIPLDHQELAQSSKKISIYRKRSSVKLEDLFLKRETLLYIIGPSYFLFAIHDCQGFHQSFLNGRGEFSIGAK